MYLRQKWIDLRQTKITILSGPFYIYRRIYFTSENASFSWHLSVLVQDSGHLAVYLLVNNLLTDNVLHLLQERCAGYPTSSLYWTKRFYGNTLVIQGQLYQRFIFQQRVVGRISTYKSGGSTICRAVIVNIARCVKKDANGILLASS